jgi:hypothetical protein
MLFKLATVVIATVAFAIAVEKQQEKNLAAKKAKAAYKPSAGPDVVGAADAAGSFFDLFTCS